MDIVIIGAGNVATHLGRALVQAGERVLQVWSRTAAHARSLAGQIGCEWTDDLQSVTPQGAMYVFCVADGALRSLAEQLWAHLTSASVTACGQGTGAAALFVHTAGSMPLDTLPAPRRGVMYPLQTFSRGRDVDFRRVPLLVESPTDEALLLSLSRRLSHTVQVADGDSRRQVHMAAVWASNFTNHMYAVAARLLERHDLPFSLLLPLIDETASKVHTLPPSAAQTGPARRGDGNVCRRHLSLLPDEGLATLYKLLSQSINDKLRLDEDTRPVL